MKQASRQLKNQAAAGQIRLGIQRLATNYPFHAAVLERFVLQACPALRTMAVNLAEHNIQLHYNPAFVMGIRLDEMVGVLLHEVHHVVFGHLLMTAADYPDEWARTVAAEITANEFIVESLPGSPIRLEMFPGLPPMESTHLRYQRLVSRQPERSSVSLWGITLPADEKESCLQLGTESLPGMGMPNELTLPSGGGELLDDHSGWAANSLTDRGKEVIRDVLQDAVHQVQDQIPDYLRDSLPRLKGGPRPGSGQLELHQSEPGILKWRILLRRYLGTHLEIQADFATPSRRLPHLVGVVPGRRRRGRLPHVMAAVDTSASLTAKQLELISAELRKLTIDYQVTVVECDVVIQRVYRCRSLVSVQGRGGTDLRPPFESGFLKKHEFDLAIYFTDGLGEAPSQPPPIPVIWCLTDGGEQPADWGEVIPMSVNRNPKPNQSVRNSHFSDRKQAGRGGNCG